MKLFLCSDRFVERDHGAGLHACGGVRLDDILGHRLVHRLVQFTNELLRFFDVSGSEKLAECSAHTVDVTLHIRVTCCANFALCERFLGV